MPNRRLFDRHDNFNTKGDPVARVSQNGGDEGPGVTDRPDGWATFPSSLRDGATAEPEAWHELVILGDVAAARDADDDGPSTLLNVAVGDFEPQRVEGFVLDLEGEVAGHLVGDFNDDGTVDAADF